MASFQRAQVETLVSRLHEPPDRIIAVFGPRQTGKTMAIVQALKSIRHESRYVAVDEPDLETPGPFEEASNAAVLPTARRDAAWLQDIWERGRRAAWISSRGHVLVLDEIQKVSEWSEAVKGLWDADRHDGCPMHVVILGSAPLLMQAGLNESLAGRFEPIRFTHWSYAEMSQAFDYSFDEYIYFGGYPGAAERRHDRDRWATYVREALVEPNIERDVLSMTRVDKPALLKRLFDLGALYSGQELSYNKMLGPLQDAGNTTTLTRYLTLLSDAGLLTGLSKHTARAASARASTPKLNVLNTALMAVASGYTFEEARADRSYWGRTIESAVGAHLVNTASSNTIVRYWRDGPHEVDFVLKRGPNTVGIEVKSGATPRPLTGLSEFKRRFNPRSIVVAGGAGVPLHEFLSFSADHWIDSA